MPTLTLIQPPGERLQFAHVDDPTMTPERGLIAFRGKLNELKAAYNLSQSSDHPEECGLGGHFNDVAGIASCALDLSLVTDGEDREFAEAVCNELKAWIGEQPDPQSWNNAFHVAMDRECEEADTL